MMYIDSAAQRAKWRRIVSQIQAGHPDGQRALWEEFSRGLIVYLAHELRREDVDDKLQDTLMAAFDRIKNGQIDDAERLPGFVRRIAHRKVADFIEAVTRRRTESSPLDPEMEVIDPQPDPEQEFLERQRGEMAARLLTRLDELDRQILSRFYLRQQPAEQICEELGLSETQFRSRKHRAKERLAVMWQRVSKRTAPGASRQPAPKIFVRKKAASGD